MPLRHSTVAYWGGIAALAVIFVAVPPLRVAAIGLGGLAGAGAIGYGLRRHRPAQQWPWYCLATGLLLSTTAQLLFRLLPGPAATYRPGSPLIYIVLAAMYVLMICGLVGLARSAPRDLTAIVDVAILLVGTGLLAGVLVAVPYAITPQLPIIQAGARILFVCGDVVLLAAAVHFATSERWNGAMALVISGVVGFLAYDALLRLQLVRGATPPILGIDLVWLLSAAAWGTAALLPSMTSLGDRGAGMRRSLPLRLILLVVASALPFALLLRGTYQRSTASYEPLVATVSSVMLALVLAQLVRLAIQLRNQVGGEQALSQAVAEVAAASDVTAVAAALESRVPLLSTGRADGALYAAAYHQSPVPPGPLQPVVTEPPEVVAGRLGVGPVLAWPMCEDGTDGRLILYLRGARAALEQAWPRIDVLATQACLVLDRARLSRELVQRTTEEYVNAVAQTSGDVILLVDDSDRIALASPTADSIFGTSELVGTRLTDLVDHPVRPVVSDLLNRARNRESLSPGRGAATRVARSRDAVSPPSDVDLGPSDGVNVASWSMHRPDGTLAQLEVACRQVTSREPSVRGLLVDLRDVTEQRRIEHELTERASRDPLTGLVSGLLVRERIRQGLEAHRDSLTCMIVLDIDDFKLINNQYGLEVGDAVLRAFAERLTSSLPLGGLAGRVAGDRFAALVDIAEPADADKTAEQLLGVLARPIEVDHAVVNCSVSAGIATTADADTPAELTRQAEHALLMARDSGRGQRHHYDPNARDTLLERLELRAALARALDDHELTLNYQPIIDLQTGGIAGFEALLRWQHRTYGQLSPTAFIDVAEESKLIIPIGDWVLATAVRDARHWASMAPDAPPFIAVNVSPVQLELSDFYGNVQDQLSRSGLPASQLHIEITESGVLGDDEIWGGIQRLREMGVQIAIDDFGTGYSALSYLSRVPVDRVKLDRQFVASMTASRTQRDLVEGIVRLTQILKLDVIAEGVETTEERDLVAEVGCRFGQGYLFARPMPADATTEWFDKTLHDRASPGHVGSPAS